MSKIKINGLDQYCAEPFEQQQFGMEQLALKWLIRPSKLFQRQAQDHYLALDDPCGLC